MGIHGGRHVPGRAASGEGLDWPRGVLLGPISLP